MPARRESAERAQKEMRGYIPEEMGRSLLDGGSGVLGPGGSMVGSPAVEGDGAAEVSAELREQSKGRLTA